MRPIHFSEGHTSKGTILILPMSGKENMNNAAVTAFEKVLREDYPEYKVDKIDYSQSVICVDNSFARQNDPSVYVIDRKGVKKYGRGSVQAVLNWSSGPDDQYAPLAVLRQFQAMGTPIFNPPEGTAFVADKLKTNQFLASTGLNQISTAPTAYAPRMKNLVEFALGHFYQDGEEPWVMKNIYGFRGQNMEMLTPEALKAKKRQRNNNPYILQSRLYPKDEKLKSHEFRYYVLKTREGYNPVFDVIAAREDKVYRKDDMREEKMFYAGNYPEDVILAKNCAETINRYAPIDFVSVDMFHSTSGRSTINEINSAPGFVAAFSDPKYREVIPKAVVKAVIAKAAPLMPGFLDNSVKTVNTAFNLFQQGYQGLSSAIAHLRNSLPKASEAEAEQIHEEIRRLQTVTEQLTFVDADLKATKTLALERMNRLSQRTN